MDSVVQWLTGARLQCIVILVRPVIWCRWVLGSGSQAVGALKLVVTVACFVDGGVVLESKVPE